ncbi:MAG: Rrf2 family transcriptional regulator [Verrucomicrobiae bacterium]|nr:Rrf2 family transcriptional regulator [Verrucomicrobiae bacterium]
MQITKAGEYALLGISYLALKGSDTWVMVEEIRQKQGISRSFLAKIFQSLSRAGLVLSQRGNRGGFRLSRPAEQINILEVLEAVEGRMALQKCLEEPCGCSKAKTCVVSPILNKAQEKVKEVFRNTSLADLTAKEQKKEPIRDDRLKMASAKPLPRQIESDSGFSVVLHD